MRAVRKLNTAVPHAPHSQHVLKQQQTGLTPQSPWSTLKEFRITPCSRLSDDVIRVPDDWLPAGSSQTPAKKRVNLLTFIPANRDRAACAYHEEQLRRMIFAFLMVPRHTQTGVRRLGTNTWLGRCRTLIKAARWSLEHRFNPRGLFLHLTLADLAEMALHIGTKAAREVNRDLAYFKKRGLLHDVPEVLTDSMLSPEETSYRDRELMRYAVEGDSEQTQPFPDDFVSEFIGRCLFISRDLGPALIRAYKALDSSDWEVHSQPAVLKRRLAIMKRLDWSLADGSQIKRLPFKIRLRSEATSYSFVEHWPPRSWPEVRRLMVFLQCANYHVLAFCTGARWSEHAAAALDCLEYTNDVRFKSKTFKLTSLVGGIERTWPLPDEAVNAVKMQQRLSRAVAGKSAKHLWIKFNNSAHNARGSALLVMNGNSEDFVRDIGLSEMLNGISPHDHRWRATMARLAAMALSEAPRILMLLFGHRNIEMTIRYILCNESIRAELDEAYQAAVYALSKRLVDEPDNFEGPAAPRLHSLIEDLTCHDDEAALAETTDEVITLLNISGQAAKRVRPHVLCIKQQGQYAPCSKGHGSPNPARCKVNCEHRLEHQDGKREAFDTIAFLICELEKPDVRAQALLVVALEGQLLTHLHRFSSVRDHWVAASPIAAAVWAKKARQ